MARRTMFGMFAGAVLAVAGAMPAAADTLAGALSNAYINSGLLDQNRAVLRAADEDVAQAIASLRPVLSWSGEVTRQYGSSRNQGLAGDWNWTASTSNDVTASLIASWTIYQGGSRVKQFYAAREAVLATRASLVSVEQQVLYDAVSAFMEVSRAMEIVQLRQNNVRVIGEEVRAARDRFEVGEVTRTDVAAAEAALAEARSNLAAAQGQLEINREIYKAAIGNFPDGIVTPAGLPGLPDSCLPRRPGRCRSIPTSSSCATPLPPMTSVSRSPRRR